MKNWPIVRCAAIVAAALFALSVTACSGGQNVTSPSPVAGIPIGANATARLTITIPHTVTRHSSHRRHYISPATQALAVTITGGPTAFSEGINLTSGNPNCQMSANLVCTVSLVLTQCPSSTACYAGTFTSYDQAFTNASSGGNCSPLSACTQPAGTNVLSAAQSVGFTIATGKANNLPITLGGVPVSVRVVSDSTSISGNSLTSFSLPTSQSGQVTALGVDADGNYILGAGAPVVHLATSDATQFTVSGPTASAPNLFTITNVSTNPASALLSATVTPTAGSGAGPLTASVGIISQPPTLYVTNSSNTVVAFDEQGMQLTLTGAFPNLHDPSGIAYDPANGFFYVANLGNSTVTAYNTQGAQQTLTGTFPNLSAPSGIAYNPANGWLYVTNIGTHTVTAYNNRGAQQTLSGTFPSISNPFGIGYDSGNGLLYVPSESASTMGAYDGQGTQQTLTGTFPNLSAPFGIAYDPGNGLLYAANAGNATVTAYSSEGAQQTHIGTFANLDSPVGIAYDPANGWLYVTNEAAGVTVYDSRGSQQTLTGTFPNLSGPFGIVVLP
jgi:DNA-binding beta-propeller fold protein YncE